MERLKGVRIAILITDGFAQEEMVEPRQALDRAGAKTIVVSPKAKRVHAWKLFDWGDEFRVELNVESADCRDFGALLLPGGVLNADTLRMIPKAVAFVQAFFDANKPVAAVGHGSATIIEAAAAYGRRFASSPSLRTDLRNAGAEWLDQPAVVDGNLLTCRGPDDIPLFNQAMIELFHTMQPTTQASLHV